MSFKVGEISSNQILENEFRIGVLENIIDLIIQKSPNIEIQQEEVESIREKVAEHLSKKYPNSGVEYKRK